MDFTLSSEQVQIRDMARQFARQEIAPVAAEHDANSLFPAEVIKKARPLGLVNATLPAELGGSGLGALDLAIIAEELAWACSGIAVSVTMNNLVHDALHCGASSEQLSKYCGVLMDGFGAYCLTEPETGSDAAAITTQVKEVEGGYLLTGRKTWITHAPQADFFVVFARHGEGVSAFLVDRGFSGLSVSKNLPKMGQRACSAAEVAFDQVSLPAQALMGKAGEGFKIAMRVFDRSRPLVAAIAVGVAQRCLDESLRYAAERKAFGKPIAEFQGIGFKLAEMGMRIQASRLLAYKAALNVDRGQPSPLEAAYAKAFAADSAMQAAVEAVQVFGGYGYSPEYPVEKLMRDAKVLQIYEGTSEIQRTIMTRELLRGKQPTFV